MKISISGCPPKITRKHIKEAVEFYASKLMSSRLCEAIDIKINFCDLKNEKGKPYKGQVTNDDWETEGLPRHFTIDIHYNNSKIIILRTLAHETAHIKQFAKGELRDYCRQPGVIRFKDEYFDEFSDEDDEAYYLSPWEVEAYGFEHCLYKLFVKEKRKK